MRHLAVGTGRAAALAAVIFILLVSTASAAEFLGGDALRVDASETVEGDLFAFGRSVVVNGRVEGDLIAAAATVEINGEVMGSIDAAAGSISLGGEIGGSVRAAAGDVTVSGSVGRDVAITGGSVSIDEGGTIAGDIAGAVGTLAITGTVDGDVLVETDDLRIDGTIGGGLDVDVDRLRVGPAARVGGDIRYTSQREGVIDESAAIGGAVQRTAPMVAGPSSYLPEHPLVTFVGLTLGLLALGWLMLFLRPAATVGVGDELLERPLLTLGAGLAGWIAQFILVLILVLLGLLVSQLAAAIGGAIVFVAVILALLIVLLAFVAQVYVAQSIGELAARLVDLSPWITYAIGAAVVAAILTLAGLHPLVFPFVYLAMWVLGLGAFLLYQARRRQEEGDLDTVVRAAPAPAPAGAAAGRPSTRTASGARPSAEPSPAMSRRSGGGSSSSGPPPNGTRRAPSPAPAAASRAAVPVDPSIPTAAHSAAPSRTPPTADQPAASGGGLSERTMNAAARLGRRFRRGPTG